MMLQTINVKALKLSQVYLASEIVCMAFPQKKYSHIYDIFLENIITKCKSIEAETT